MSPDWSDQNSQGGYTWEEGQTLDMFVAAIDLPVTQGYYILKCIKVLSRLAILKLRELIVASLFFMALLFFLIVILGAHR